MNTKSRLSFRLRKKYPVFTNILLQMNGIGITGPGHKVFLLQENLIFATRIYSFNTGLYLLFLFTHYTLVEVITLIQISKLLLVLENFTSFFFQFEKYDSKFSKKISCKFFKFAKKYLFPPYTQQVK